MEACTCHISNLRCKNEKCLLLITARGLFKSKLGDILGSIFENLQQQGFQKKECVRALRREVNHRNSIQHDIFDVMANAIWIEEK